MKCDALFEAYLRHAQDGQRPSTYDNTARNLNKYAASLHREPIEAIDRARLYELHQRLGREIGKVAANRVLSTLGACWSWALKTGHIATEANPAAFVPKFAETARSRDLSLDEIALIWRCAGDGGAFDRLVRLILCTACRRQEAGDAQWSEISKATWLIPAERMKRGLEHEVHLTELALAQLHQRVGPFLFGKGGEGGFDGWSRAKARLDRRIALARASDAGVVTDIRAMRGMASSTCTSLRPGK